MNSRFVKRSWLAAAVLAMTLGVAAVSYAQDFNLRVDIGNSPRWRRVHGTRVYEVYGARPGYDVYRYGGAYYVYDNDNWYMSRDPYGHYVIVDYDRVPRDFRRVPRSHWHRYPSRWDNNRDYRDRGYRR